MELGFSSDSGLRLLGFLHIHIHRHRHIHIHIERERARGREEGEREGGRERGRCPSYYCCGGDSLKPKHRPPRARDVLAIALNPKTPNFLNPRVDRAEAESECGGAGM